MENALKLEMLDAKIGDIMIFEEEGEIGYWKVNGFAAWEIDIEKGGFYDIYMLVSAGENQGGDGVIKTPAGEVKFRVYETASFSCYKYICVKNVEFVSGRQEMKILPTALKHLFFMNLKEVIVLPSGTSSDKEILTYDIKRKPVEVSDEMLPCYKGKKRKELYKYRIDRMLEEYDASGGKKVTWNGGYWHGLAIMWRKTKDTKYLDRIVKKARLWIMIYKKTGNLPQYNFSSKIGIVELLEAAMESPDFSKSEKEAAKEMIVCLIFNSAYEGGGVMNRNIGYCLGIVAADNYIKAEPRYKIVKAMSDNLTYELEKTLEPLENSANYEDITLMYLINYIEKSGREDLFGTDGIKNTLYSFLYKLTPDCGLPSYGDYGGLPTYRELMVSIFEAAARIYNDGQFSYAAERICERLESLRVDAKDEYELDGWVFLGFAHAYEWCDENVKYRLKEDKSRVIYRNDKSPDKAVFMGGGLYMLMDFINGCEHGSNNALGVMSVVKDGRVALFDMGHRDEGNHSKPIARYSDENFPKVKKVNDCWEEGSIHLPSCWSWGTFADSTKRYHTILKNGVNDSILGPDGIDYDPKKQFLLAFLDWKRFQIPYRKERKCGRLCIKNMRLVKADKQELLLDIKSEFLGGEYENGVLKIDFDSEKSWVFAAKVFDFPLDIAANEYEYLKFDIKTEGIPVKELLLTVGDSSYYPHNYPMFHNPMNKAELLYFNESEKGCTAGFILREKIAVTKREIAFINGIGIRVRDTISANAGCEITAGCAWRCENVEKLCANTWLSYGECDMKISFLDSPEVVEDPIRGHESEKEHNRFALCLKKRGKGSFVFDTLLHFNDFEVFNEEETVIDGVRVIYTENGFLTESR